MIMPHEKLKTKARYLRAAKEAKVTLQAMTFSESSSFANMYEAKALEYAGHRPAVNVQADPTTIGQKGRD